MTRILYLIRHGKSDWHSGAGSDFDRPLNARGREEVPKAGQRLAANYPAPALWIVSPARRTRETARLLQSAWQGSVTEMQLRPELYLAPPDQIHTAALEGLALGAGPVAIVGHNPGLSELFSEWTGRPVDFKTSACGVLEFSSPSFSRPDKVLFLQGGKDQWSG